MFFFRINTLLFFVGFLNFNLFTQNNALKFKLENKNIDDSSYTILVKGNLNWLQKNQSPTTFKFNYYVNDVASITTNLSTVATLIETKKITYAEFIKADKKLMNDTILVRNRILPVKQGQIPLTQAYDGTGVIVGIIDSGIDFNHPDFKNSNGTTRLLALWDQNPTTNSASPQPYNYGIEWTPAQINSSLCTHDDLSYYGHGTHVSGIAAGNALATGNFMGIASKSDMIVVAVNFGYNAPTVADAVNFIFAKATALGRPCVINASVGGYYGSHDGTDLEAQMINGMVSNQPGRAMVAAAGNGGHIKFHTKTQLTNTDTVFSWITSGNATIYHALYADTAQIKNVGIRVGANRADFSDIGNIGFKSWNYALQSLKTDTLKNANGQRMGIVKSSASINSFGVYELEFQILADTLNLNWRIDSKGIGLHHAWNFNFVSSGLPTPIQYPKVVKHIMPDTMYTLVSSFQCLTDVITVANYVNMKKYYTVDNVLQVAAENTGELAYNSSTGPTRDNKIKPDIAATGRNTFSAMALGMKANLIANAPYYVSQDSVHVWGDGTSAASPVVAGLVALYLQKNPTATVAQIRNAITTCAYTDNFTGAVPNFAFGHGKIDGKAAMLCNQVITNISTNSNSNNVSVFPNPILGDVKIDLKETNIHKIELFAIDGKLIFSETVTGSNYVIQSSLTDKLVSGMYLLQIKSDTYQSTIKLVK